MKCYRLRDLGRGRYANREDPIQRRGPRAGYKRYPWTRYRAKQIPPTLEFMPIPVRGPKPRPKVDVPAPGEQETAKFCMQWITQFPHLTAALNDPKTFWMASDFAADLLNCSRDGFIRRYIRTGRLPYYIATWPFGTGGKLVKNKIFVPRSLVHEQAVLLVLSHRRSKSDAYLARKKMATLHGLDAIAERLYPNAPPVVSHTGHEPLFKGKKPHFLRKTNAGSKPSHEIDS